MTFECGMRFLTDHLSGDVYFKIHREGHNLDRARNQFALVADMERYKERGCRMEYIGLNGEELDDGRTYTVGMTKNCFKKFKRYFGCTIPEERASLIAISTFSDLARWMITQNEKITVRDRGRFEILHPEYLYND